MRKHIILVLVAVAVLLAGCIQWPPGATPAPKGIAAGVIIKSFSPVNPEISSGDEAYFSFTIENIGEADAHNVQVRLFGLGTDWTPPTGFKHIGFLAKANPRERLLGDTASDEFISQSPPHLKVDTTYTAIIRVSYNYTTSAEGKIKLYSKKYLNTLPIEESRRIRASSGIESFTVTKGPIQVSLAGLSRPLEDGGVGRSITIVIENVGQGGNYWADEGDRKIWIKNITVDKNPCRDQTFPRVETLPRVGSKMIRCSFTTFSPVETFTTIPVKIELEYKYFVDASTSIKVLKASE